MTQQNFPFLSRWLTSLAAYSLMLVTVVACATSATGAVTATADLTGSGRVDLTNSSATQTAQVLISHSATTIVEVLPSGFGSAVSINQTPPVYGWNEQTTGGTVTTPHSSSFLATIAPLGTFSFLGTGNQHADVTRGTIGSADASCSTMKTHGITYANLSSVDVLLDLVPLSSQLVLSVTGVTGTDTGRAYFEVGPVGGPLAVVFEEFNGTQTQNFPLTPSHTVLTPGQSLTQGAWTKLGVHVDVVPEPGAALAVVLGVGCVSRRRVRK